MTYLAFFFFILSFSAQTNEPLIYAPIDKTINIGFADDGSPLDEQSLYDWNPMYSIGLPAFDENNVAYFRKRGAFPHAIPPDGFEHFENNQIKVRPYLNAVLSIFPKGTEFVRSIGGNGRRPIVGVFNEEGRLFTLLGVFLKTPGIEDSYRTWVMLSSTDKGITWDAFKIVSELDFKNKQCPSFIPTGRECKFPNNIDFNRTYSRKPIPNGSLDLILFEKTGSVGLDPDARFDPEGRLSLLSLKTTKDSLEFDFFVSLTDRSLGIGSHSGGGTKVIRKGGKVFLTWLEGTRTPLQGSPTFVAEYDIKTAVLTKKMVANSFPANDGHNQPAMVISSKGVIHIVIGAHGSHMFHSYSLAPDSIENMSSATPLSLEKTGDKQIKAKNNVPGWNGGAQTYIALVIDSNDALHAVYRQWRKENGVFNKKKFGALIYQKFENQLWSKPEVLVYPNFGGYFIYYHHLTLDRKDRLFLSYHRHGHAPPYQSPSGKNLLPQFGQPALLMSKDQGISWFLTTNDELINGAD